MPARANSSGGSPLRLYRVGDVCRELRVSGNTVRRWVKEGKLACVMVHGQRRFRQADVHALSGSPQTLIVFSPSVSVSAKRRFPGLPVEAWNESTVDKVLAGTLDNAVLVTEEKNCIAGLLLKVIQSRGITIVPVHKRPRLKGDRAELAEYLKSERPTYEGYLSYAKSPVSEKQFGIAKKAANVPQIADPVECLLAFASKVRKCNCGKRELWRKYLEFCSASGSTPLPRQRVMNDLEMIRG